MDKYKEYSKLGFPLFDGKNYFFWSIQMKLFIQSQGLDFWKVVENGCTILATNLVVGITEIRLMERNEKAMYAIQGGLIGSEFVKVIQCTSAKEISDKLKNVYEGYGKVKQDKLQTYRRQLEHLKNEER